MTVLRFYSGPSEPSCWFDLILPDGQKLGIVWAVQCGRLMLTREIDGDAEVIRFRYIRKPKANKSATARDIA